MGKDGIIGFRADSKLLSLLKDYCIENNITVSGYFTILLQDIFINKKVNKNLEKNIQIFVIKSQRTDLCSKLYITKNMYRRVMDMALSSYFTSRNVNMKAINAVLDSFVAEFENYDESIKNAVQIDFKLTVKRLRSKEFLLGQSQNFKMLKYIQK